MKNYIISALSIVLLLLIAYVFSLQTQVVPVVTDVSLFSEKFSGEHWGFEYIYPNGYVGEIDLENEGQKVFAIKQIISDPTYEESFLTEATGNEDYYEGICSNCSMTIEVQPNFLNDADGKLVTPDEWFKLQDSLNTDTDSATSSYTMIAGHKARVDVFEDDTWYTLFSKNASGYNKYWIRIKNDNPDKDTLLAGFSLK